MDFYKIKDALKLIQFDDIRVDNTSDFEAVVSVQDAAKLNRQLQDFFGQPVFPSQNKLSSDIKKIIDPHGGIMPGQTLYFSDDAGNIIFAMLWPWQNGKSVTVKLYRK